MTKESEKKGVSTPKQGSKATPTAQAGTGNTSSKPKTTGKENTTPSASSPPNPPEVAEGINAFADSDASPAVKALGASRFASVAFSEKAKSVSKSTANLATALAKHIEAELPSGREKELALTHLEYCYMRVNRACREI